MTTFETSAFGLDIDQRSVRLVRVVQRLGRIQVSETQSFLLPENESGHESVIRRTVESLGLSGEPCGIAIFGRGVILNTLVVPPHDRSHAQVAEAEIYRLGFLSEEPMTADFSTFRSDTSSGSVLIGMAQSQIVEDALSIPDRIGLHVSRLVPIPMAMLRTIQTGPESRTLQILAHIRAESTHLMIGNRNGIIFSRRFEIGSAHFTKALQAGSNRRVEAPEDFKKRIELGHRPDPATPDQEMPDSLSPTVDEWVGELQSSLSLWRGGNSDRIVNELPIILSGADVHLRGFPAYVGTKLKRPVQLIGSNLPGLSASSAPEYTVALGLALSAIETSNRSINLMPRNRQMAIHLQARRKSWLNIAALLGLTLLSVLVGSTWRLTVITREVLAANEKIKTLQSAEEAVNRVKDDGDLLKTQLDEAKQGTRTSRTLKRLIQALGTAKNENDWVTIIADSQSYFSGETAPDATPIATTNGTLSTVIVEGYTPKKDFSTVLTMIESLRHEPCVIHADLVADDRIPATNPARDIWAGLDVILFVIEIKIQNP